MTWKKRIISIVLCLCALLCAASVRAEAADHSHPICGGTTGTTCTHAGDKHTSNVTWTAWDGTQEINNSSNLFNDTSELYLYLSGDVTTSKNIIVPKNKTLYLCLNGYSLANIGQYESYTIQVDGTLVLCDCNSSKQNNGNITHGMRANGTKNTGAGVAVYDGTFIMYGGKISNNASRGVDVNGGTFTMYGGEISGNTYTDNPNYNYGGGAGVRVRDYDTVQGNFAMYGGKISNNTYKGGGDGGGVYASGTGDFIIQGGRITDNQCSYNGTNTSVTTFGGGLYITDRHSTLKIENNTVISNNTCDGDGGGIFIGGDATGSITNCTISNNAATGKSSKGGGLAFQNSTFTLKECTITGNKAQDRGGGIFVLDNTANLTLSGSMNFSGNQDNYPADESGNLTTGTENDVHLNTSSVYLRLASDFSKTSGAIVVTTYFTPNGSGYQKIAEDNRPTPKPGDFKYGNDNTAVCTYTYPDTTGENVGKVELRACKHSYGAWTPNGNEHQRQCTNCDTTETAAHSGGTASCTAKAKCSVCGQEYGGYAAHVYDTTKWVKIDDGHHGHKCKNCNAIDESTKASHTEGTAVQENGVAADCTTAGSYDEVVYCAVCNTKLSSTHKTINPLGHVDDTPVKENVKEATCTAEGSYDEVVYCTVCKNEVSRTQKTIAKLDHDYNTETWVNGDSDPTHHWHKCNNCDAITDVTAHTPDRDKATETEAKVCKDCDWVIAPATHPVHTWVFVAETPATCNATGVKEHYKCDCRRKSVTDGVYDIVSDTELILAINPANHTGAPDSKWHSDSANHWQEYTCCHARANEAAHSGGAATCTAQAVCQVCDKAYGPLAAHDWQPATCTAPKTCSVCHVTDGAALGHDWGAWKMTTPATKDAPGVETRTCTHNSAHTETRSIPKLSTAVYTVSEDTKIAQIEAKVDGLDKILELNENKALVNDGKSVGVSLTVKNTASSGVSEKIKEKLAGSNLVGLRLELTVEKTVTANGVVEPKQTIHDAGVLLKTTITLPAELQGKSGYVVYRLHDENVHVLTETANENGEFISVSADKTQITICARLYSEYVIAYQTGGSSGGGYHPVNPTPVKATSANTGDAGVLLYGVTAALSLTGTAWLGAKSRKH